MYAAVRQGKAKSGVAEELARSIDWGGNGGRSAREGRQGGIWPRGRRAPGFTMGLGDRAVQGHWRGRGFVASSPEPANSATPLWVQRRYLASVLVTDYATKRIGNPSAICRGQS